MSSFEPSVSVIMPAYNAEKTISESVDSVLSQTFQDWELIIIDDCSLDSTAQIAQSAAEKDSRIRFFRNDKNLNVALTRNCGISQAKGKLIAFLDSDDLWREDKLEKQLKLMKESGAAISYTATAYIYEGTRSDYVLKAKPKLTYSGLLKRNLMSCSSVMVRRDVISRYPFPQGNLHEDYVVWLKILKSNQHAVGLDEPLLIYRVSPTSKSGNLKKSADMIYHAYKHVGFNNVSAFFLTLRYALHSVPKRFFVRRCAT